jgi:hypothetical protein
VGNCIFSLSLVLAGFYFHIHLLLSFIRFVVCLVPEEKKEKEKKKKWVSLLKLSSVLYNNLRPEFVEGCLQFFGYVLLSVEKLLHSLLFMVNVCCNWLQRFKMLNFYVFNFWVV